MKHAIKWALALICASSLTSCGAITPADKLTHDEIAPAHAAYVQADPVLTAEQKQRRLDLLESWRVRVGGAK